MSSSFGFWKLAWRYNAVTEEELRSVVDVDITEEEFETITGIIFK